MIGLIIFFAGAKEETAAEPFSDPRVAIGEEIHLMTTFEEMRRRCDKKRKRFLRGLAKRRKSGYSGKEFWKWIPGMVGKYKISNKGRVKKITRKRSLDGKEGLKSFKEVILTESEIKTLLETSGGSDES